MIRRSLREMSCNHNVYFGDYCEACSLERREDDLKRHKAKTKGKKVKTKGKDK